MKLFKWLFKFRMINLWWLKIYFFTRTRYEISVGIDLDGYPLLFIGLIFITIEIEFAPIKYYLVQEDRKTYEYSGQMRLTEEEEEEARDNLIKHIFGNDHK